MVKPNDGVYLRVFMRTAAPRVRSARLPANVRHPFAHSTRSQRLRRHKFTTVRREGWQNVRNDIGGVPIGQLRWGDCVMHDRPARGSPP